MINGQIRDREVRLISENGDQLGIMPTSRALQLAEEAGLDLVKIAPKAQPPVCKIIDYGKYRYEQTRKEKEARKKQQVVELKEVQLSCRIDTHDFETKARNAQKFLAAGNKVRVVMRFRGREMSHMAIGREIIDKFAEICSDVGTVDKKHSVDGRIMSMVVTPINTKSAK